MGLFLFDRFKVKYIGKWGLPHLAKKLSKASVLKRPQLPRIDFKKQGFFFDTQGKTTGGDGFFYPEKSPPRSRISPFFDPYLHLFLATFGPFWTYTDLTTRKN